MKKVNDCAENAYTRIEKLQKLAEDALDQLSNERRVIVSDSLFDGATTVLTKKEKGFLITCIMSAASDGFDILPRYNDRWDTSSGIKYNRLNETEIINVLEKLGGDNDDLKQLIGYL